MHELTPVSSLLGGVLIGASASFFLYTHGRIAGISGLWAGILRSAPDRRIRIAFIAGLVLSGLVFRLAYPAAFATTWSASLPMAGLAGLLVGFGTQLGSGCTSGHGVCGISRLSGRSLVATCVFVFTGFATVYVVRHVIGAHG
jgi:uncharacterized protein